MSDFDWETIRRGKELHRAKSAALPFDEKLRILERMRERTREMRTGQHVREVAGRVIASGIHVFGVEASSRSASTTIRLGVFGAGPALLSAVAPTQLAASAANIVENLDSRSGSCR